MAAKKKAPKKAARKPAAKKPAKKVAAKKAAPKKAAPKKAAAKKAAPKKAAPKKPKAKVWDAEGVKIAGAYSGTLNDDSDVDTSWTCEVAIPLKNFASHMPHLPPLPGEHWNLNLNRHGGKTNMQYSQWSKADTPEPSFHTPHRFGRAVFSDRVSPFGRE